MKKLFISSSLLLSIISCTNEKGPSPLKLSSGCDSIISYGKTIAPIMSANCSMSGCHDSKSSYGDFSSYAGLKIKVDNGSIKSKVLDLKTMPISPISPLSEKDLKSIDCWIKQGATNSGGDVPSSGTTAVNTCDTTVTYLGTIAPLISTYCVTSGCHDAGSGNIDYSTYAGLKRVADNGKLFTRVVDKKTMPAFPVFPLSESQISQINCWIKQGALNNGVLPTNTNTTCLTTISYSTSIAPLISTSCSISGCHDAASGNGDFTTYLGLKTSVSNGTLNSRVIVRKNMPIAPVKALTEVEISTINCWIKQGGANN